MEKLKLLLLFSFILFYTVVTFGQDLKVSSGTSVNLDPSTTLTVRNFSNSGTFTINSDETYNGSFIVTGNSSGSITYNRWLSSDRWHLVAAPVTGQTIADFINVNLSNLATNDIKYGLAPYNNSTPGWAHYTSSNTDGSFISGKGYEAMRKTSDGTLAFSGAVATDDVSIDITKSKSGWNLVGNPFPSAINGNDDADASNNFLTVNTASIDENYLALYVWDAATNAYLTVNQNYLSNNAFYVAPGQGFFVYPASASESLRFSEAMQTHQTGNIFKSEGISFPSILLKAKNGAYTSSTHIKYIDGTTTGLDPGYDAGRFSGGDNSFAIYTHLVGDEKNTVDFDIQCLPYLDIENMTIPVGLNAVQGSNIVFSIEQSNIPEEYAIILEDKATNTYTDLSDDGAEYSIQLNADSDGIGRFFVYPSFKSTLGTNELGRANAFQVYGQKRNNQVVIRGDVTAHTRARIYSLDGKLITDVNLIQANENYIKFNEIAGIYIIQITNEIGIFRQKLLWVN